jgi:undecaprenyl-phosphate 4-deoxy-4-formamido-L-arabinose transferase
LVAGAGVIAAIAFIIERERNPNLPIGWASLVVSVMVLSGAQLFTLGMLGEYTGRMFLKIGGEPQFIVRDTVNCDPSSAKRNLDDEITVPLRASARSETGSS